MYQKHLVGFVLMMLTIMGCTKELTVYEYIDQVANEPDYKKEIIHGDYVFTGIYRPSELICLSEVSKGKENFVYSKEEFEKELIKYSNAYYFDFSIGAKDKRNMLMEGVRNQTEYTAKLSQLTFVMEQKCFLILDKRDTVKAITCNFSNTFGNNPDLNFLLLFPKNRKSISAKTIEMTYVDDLFNLNDKVVLAYQNSELTKKFHSIVNK